MAALTSITNLYGLCDALDEAEYALDGLRPTYERTRALHEVGRARDFVGEALISECAVCCLPTHECLCAGSHAYLAELAVRARVVAASALDTAWLALTEGVL